MDIRLYKFGDSEALFWMYPHQAYLTQNFESQGCMNT